MDPISNQAKYVAFDKKKSEKIESENEALKSKVENLNQDAVNSNEKLDKKSDELLAQINGMLQPHS